MTPLPYAIYPYELSTPQLKALFRTDKGFILMAWHTQDGPVVYMTGEQTRSYLWRGGKWQLRMDD